MTFKYGDTIEYIDCTYDENFNEARQWAVTHNTTFEEDLEKRNLPLRYFVIGPEPKKPEPYVPTEDELKQQVRQIRNSCLEKFVDPKQLVLVWESLSEEDKNNYRQYRIYLLDYTKEEEWWLKEPLTFEEWKNNFDN